MRYSYEYKRKCVEMYRQGQWPDTPNDLSQRYFRHLIKEWVKMEDANGPQVLKHKGTNKIWTPEEKLEMVSAIIANKGVRAVAYENGIHHGMLSNWVRKYKILGYNGLIQTKKGRLPKEPKMKKLNINKPRKLEESEYEELIRLRAENAYIKAENEVIKKEIALREEKQAARLKAKKQPSLKSLEKKVTN